MKRVPWMMIHSLASYLLTLGVAGLASLPGFSGAVFADSLNPVTPRVSDRCPVCGMTVDKYRSSSAQVVFKDGGYAVFDGAKDLLTFYLDVGRYARNRSRDDIVAIYVTDYYRLQLIDARAAFYVLGSDVMGPMGRDLIPFQSLDDARTFIEDHKGQMILRFDDLSASVLFELR